MLLLIHESGHYRLGPPPPVSAGTRLKLTQPLNPFGNFPAALYPLSLFLRRSPPSRSGEPSVFRGGRGVEGEGGRGVRSRVVGPRGDGLL